MLDRKCDIRDGLATLGHPIEKGIDIGAVISISGAVRYVLKDGNYLEEGDRPNIEKKIKIDVAKVKKSLNNEFKAKGCIDKIKLIDEHPYLIG